MLCRLRREPHPVGQGGPSSWRPESRERNAIVYDMDQRGYRCVPLDTLQALKVDGSEYRLIGAGPDVQIQHGPVVSVVKPLSYPAQRVLEKSALEHAAMGLAWIVPSENEGKVYHYFQRAGFHVQRVA
jgi:hypothetical protein